MSRVDPFVTYVGAAGLVIGSIGLAFSGDASQPLEVSQPRSEIAQGAAPAMAAAPIAFYAEMLELISPPPIGRTEPRRPEEHALDVPSPRPERVSTPIREQRSREPAQVIVHMGRFNTKLYFVEREGR